MDPVTPAAAAFRAAVERADAQAIRTVGRTWPDEVGAMVDLPWFAFGAPALVHVAQPGHREALDALLDLGADPDARSTWEPGPYTALTRLLDAGGPRAMALGEHLVDRGATVDLHAAAGLGRLDDLARLLDAAPERVSEPGPDGATPLHLAATPEVAEALLERGAELDRPCVDHRSTAAMWALSHRPAVTRYLVSRGARPDLFMAAALDDVDLARRVLADAPDAVNVRLRPGAHIAHLGGGDKYVWALGFADTAAEVARRRGHDAVYALILQGSPPLQRLIQAARRADLAAMNRLLDETPGLLDAADDTDRLDLLSAPAPALRLVLARGVAPDARDPIDGVTALHRAAWDGDGERVRLLIEAGADATIRDRTHHGTALGWARHAGHHAIARLLEAAGGV